MMSVSFLALLSGVALTSAAALPPTNVYWDGRVPPDFLPEDFDSWSNSPYNNGWNKGQNQTWADIITFPDVPQSLFDYDEYKPLELEINDQSIFVPGGNAQLGFRRSELIPKGNTGDDDATTGIATLHFSLRTDPAKKLNVTHQYELIFLEAADYASHIFAFKAGTPRDGRQTQYSNGLRLESSTKAGNSRTLYEINFTDDVWHNFAVQINFDTSRLSAYYSQDNNPLQRVVNNISNDATGRGQYHLGILKLPSGPTDDVVNRGYQPSGISEGLIFGGIYIEKGSTVTLS